MKITFTLALDMVNSAMLEFSHEELMDSPLAAKLAKLISEISGPDTREYIPEECV